MGDWQKPTRQSVSHVRDARLTPWPLITNHESPITAPKKKTPAEAGVLGLRNLPWFRLYCVRGIPYGVTSQLSIVPVSPLAASYTRSFQEPLSGSADRSTV